MLRSADYNQADECFPADAIGRQCVPSCLMFLITASQILSCEDIQTADLNDILFACSHLYCAIHQSDSNLEFTDPANLPERVSYKGNTVYISHGRVASGVMQENSILDGQN